MANSNLRTLNEQVRKSSLTSNERAWSATGPGLSVEFTLIHEHPWLTVVRNVAQDSFTTGNILNSRYVLTIIDGSIPYVQLFILTILVLIFYFDY